mgnify:CR=1 FL=1
MLRFDRFFCVLFCFVLFCCCGCVFVSCNCCLVHALHALSPLREQYLTQAELNPRIRALPTENRGGLDFLYHRTRYVLSHPCCALWFTFWDDVWENNNKLTILKDKGEDFDPKYVQRGCAGMEVMAPRAATVAERGVCSVVVGTPRPSRTSLCPATSWSHGWRSVVCTARRAAVVPSTSRPRSWTRCMSEWTA